MNHYVATPKEEKAPGIVLIQEIFGINKPMRSIADTWAEEGFLVMAPDLFWRLKPDIDLMYDPESRKQAIDYMNRFDKEQGVEDLGQTIEALKSHSQCNGKIAVMGFCLGGLMTYLTALRYPVDSAVSFYGVRLDAYLERQVSCPIIFHFGAEDDFVASDKIAMVEAAYPGTVHVYPKTKHGFYNRDRVEYNEKAAKEAHKHSLKLLNTLK